MANTWINHPNGSSNNGGGYTGNYAGTWAQWHNGTFGPVASLVAGLTSNNGSDKVRITSDASSYSSVLVGTIAFVDFSIGTHLDGRYEVTAVSGDGAYIDINLVYAGEEATTSSVGGALDSIDDGRALLAADGDRQLICTNTTTQSTYAMAAGTYTWPDYNIEVVGVNEATGGYLSFDPHQAPDAAGNIIPQIYNGSASNTYYLFGAANFVVGLYFVGYYSGAAVNHNISKIGILLECCFKNDGTGAAIYGGYCTICSCRILGKVTSIIHGQLIDCVVIDSSDSGNIVYASTGLSMYGIIRGNLIVNAAGTKTTVVGLSLGITAYYKSNSTNNTIVNCASGINIATDNRTGIGIIAHNLIYNCTNAYSISGDYSAKANQFLFSENAYNGTRNLPAGAHDDETDLVLTSDPFVNAAAGDYRLNPAGAQFASLYDADTGERIGAQGPEMPTGGGGGGNVGRGTMRGM